MRYREEVNAVFRAPVRTQAATKLKSAWLQAVSNIKSPHADPVVALQDGHCSCGRVAVPQMAQKLGRPTDWQVCPSCRRILVHEHARSELWK